MANNCDGEKRNLCVCRVLEAEQALEKLTSDLNALAFPNLAASDHSVGLVTRDYAKRAFGSAKAALDFVGSTCDVNMIASAHEVEIAMGLFNDSQYVGAWDHAFTAKKNLKETFCSGL